MNERLYYANAYQKDFDAEVQHCDATDDGSCIVTLNRTAFYPEGGGQPSDIGELGGVKVLYVYEKNGVIYHRTDKELNPGSAVEGHVDFERRFGNMQNHSGEHIVSGLIKDKFGFDNVGFHMGSEFITIDFNGELNEQMLEEIENLANEAVYKNVGVEVMFPGAKELKEMSYRSKKELTGDVRIVRIPGADTCACCGVHVSRSGEVGLIKFISHQKYKGGTRVNMLSGKRALNDYREKNRNVNCLSALLSSKPHEVVTFTENLLSECSDLRYKLAQQKLMRFKFMADSYEPCERIALFEDDLTPNELKQLSLLLCEKSGIAAVFSAQDKVTDFKYAVASKKYDMTSVVKQLNQRFSGRGGGSKELVQGSVTGDKREIEVFLRQVEDVKETGNS